MKRSKAILEKVTACLIAAAVMLTFPLSTISAEEVYEASDSEADNTSESGYEVGKTYSVEASLSCYVNAMGGVEFGSGIMRGMTFTVDENGQIYATIKLGTGTGNIYTVDFVAFIDPIAHPGFYTAAGALNKSDVTYTISTNSAQNSDGQLINYVDSMTFPIDSVRSSYYLYLYVNSNVMGVQFCNGTGSSGSGYPNVLTPYRAVLTVNWDSASEGSSVTTERSSTVIYDTGDIINAFEVEIPAIIQVDPSTKKAVYTIQAAESFSLPEGKVVTVSAEDSGLLRNESINDTVVFENELSASTLRQSGDTIVGHLTVTGNPVTSEKYTGTLHFTISLDDAQDTQ